MFDSADVYSKGLAEEVLGTPGTDHVDRDSNFSGWHLMKSLAVLENYHLVRHAAYPAYCYLVERYYEWELMSLGLDRNLQLGWDRLSGMIRRGSPLPAFNQLHKTAGDGCSVPAFDG